MTEEKPYEIKWKKTIPLLVGFVLGIVLLLVFISNPSEVELSDETSYPQIVQTENGRVEKNYDSQKKEVSLRNDATKEEILTAKLNTPEIYQVPVGYQKVAEFSINPKQDYENILGNIKLLDLKNKNKNINRQIDIKYWAIKNITVNEYSCIPVTLNNGTIGNDCNITGTNVMQIREWTDWNKDVFENEEIIIGLFMDIGYDETIEWIPTLADVEIQEWAVVTSGATTSIDGSYTVVSYINNGTFNVTGNSLTNVEILVVGGGGGGSYISGGNSGGGGGGGGVIHNNSVTLQTENYNIVVGVGGTGRDTNFGINGQNSSFGNSNFMMVGFGGGGGGSNNNAQQGGSGGGGGAGGSPSGLSGASSIQNSNNGTGYGNAGGNAADNCKGGGGGGANATSGTGANAVTGTCDANGNAGAGGNGTGFNITNGTILYYAGGGGGGDAGADDGLNNGGIGGGGKGGNGAVSGVDGTNGLGGGGGGGNTGGAGNGGSGRVIIRYLTIETGGVFVTLLSPENNTNFTTNLINFSVDVTNASDVSITNVSLLINGQINQTNTTGIEDIYFFNTSTLADGSYNWTVIAFGNDSVQYNASNGTLFFTVDSSAPIIDAFFPTGNITFHERNTNISFNWSANDTSLDTCLFQYRGINTTVTCSANQTTFNITDGINKSLIFFVNDTLGRVSSENITWDYRLFLHSETFSANVTEGTTTTFSANLLTNGSSITGVNLSYNGTNNIGSINNHGGNNFTITETINVPSVTANTNVLFFWNITQGTLNHALDAQNQTILNFGIDNCVTNTITLYNFTIINERTQDTLNQTSNNTEGKVDLQIYSFGTTSLVQQFNRSYSQVNPFAVCINSSLSGGENYNIDVQVQYEGDSYESEFYNIQNNTINSSALNQNITLYDLNTSESQIFTIVFRDASFIPVEDALIEVERKYIDEGVFRIVEIPQTDANGKAVAHLVLNEVIYNFRVVKFGEVLGTFSDVIAVCQIPLVQTCTIDFNSFADTIDLPDFEEAEDFSFTLGYDNATRVVTSVFSIPSGTSALVTLNVTREDSLGTAVCSDQLTSSSGTLTCTVPASFGNSTIKAELYKANSIQAQGQIKLDQNPIDIYGVTLIGLSIFIMMTLIGVGISNNPVVTVLFLMLGVVLLFSLNLVSNNGFIGATATILWLFIAMIIILIKGVKRN